LFQPIYIKPTAAERRRRRRRRMAFTVITESLAGDKEEWSSAGSGSVRLPSEIELINGGGKSTLKT
jgi:hypothetical protein